MKRKKITLSGVETNNKGAELMLYAILQEIERKYPDAIVYVQDKSVQQGLDYIKTNLTLKEKPIVKIRKWCDKLHLLNFIINRLHISPIKFEDIYAIKGNDYYFDGSGFRYSDQWKRKRYAKEVQKRRWANNKKEKSKIVFLPQAFGPFNEKYSQNELRQINEVADLIMPREEVSYNYLKSSGIVDMNKVRLHTDFTSLVHGEMPSGYEHLKGAVCVIPNARMIDHGNITLTNYIQFIVSIIEITSNAGRKVYLLNHEGKGDEKIAYQIQEALKGEIEVVTGLNALEVKGLLSTAHLVITSRFHGVASALNSCVPCLATSWSHKYAELYKDYGQEDCILPLDKLELTMQKVLRYMAEEKNSEVRKSLQIVRPKIQADTQKMWEEIWNFSFC